MTRNTVPSCWNPLAFQLIEPSCVSVCLSSAGIGRTGTIVVIDMILHTIYLQGKTQIRKSEPLRAQSPVFEDGRHQISVNLCVC